MKPSELYEQIKKLKGSNQNQLTNGGMHESIVILLDSLVNSNRQYSKITLGDKLLGVNSYQRKKLTESVDENNDYSEVVYLFSDMISEFLNKFKISDVQMNTLIIALVTNGFIDEFRQIRKLSESRSGLIVLDFISNLNIGNESLKEAFLSELDEYPIHSKILNERYFELMITGNLRERYLILMKDAWNTGELEKGSEFDEYLIERLFELRRLFKAQSTNISMSDLTDLLGMGESTYRNNKRKIAVKLTSYYSNSIYSNLIAYFETLN